MRSVRERRLRGNRAWRSGTGGAHGPARPGRHWAGRQMVARFFIAGFGDEATAHGCALVSGECVASVAISEPRVGAHPKLLTTRADVESGRVQHHRREGVGHQRAGRRGVRRACRHGDRRRPQALRRVPGAARHAGPVDRRMPEYRALAPSRHCGLVLDGCRVPHSALLGPAGSAYEAMALPFRDVEDAVGTFGLLGAFRFLLSWFAAARSRRRGGAVAGRSGGTDRGIRRNSATRWWPHSTPANSRRARPRWSDCACWRPRCCNGRARIATHSVRRQLHIERVFGDVEVSLSVARGPRLARQTRLGSELIAAAARG